MIDDEAGVSQLGRVIGLGADAVRVSTKTRLREFSLRPMIK